VVKGPIALQEIRGRHGHPKLKELVLEASRALARLDADRLEELALSCQALNRDLAEGDWTHGNRADRAALALEAQEAVGDMAVFSRVLEATRANLNVMNRLRELRGGRLEYGEGRFEFCQGGSESGALQSQRWRRTESRHGDN
jgi:hypothetical protein